MLPETGPQQPSLLACSKRRASGANSEARKAAANEGEDELKDALDELNRSVNRLRREFDVTGKWMETKVHTEQVFDDSRGINQTLARGDYGSEVARL